MLSYTANICEMPSLLTHIDSLERHKIIILNIKRRRGKEPREGVFFTTKMITCVEKRKASVKTHKAQRKHSILCHAIYLPHITFDLKKADGE